MESESARDRMAGVLSHELAHIVSRDLQWNLWLHLVSILLWFHPLAWRVRAANAMAGEEVCDAASASILGDVNAYSRILASEVAEMAGPIPAASIPMARTSEIGRRLATLKRKVFNMSLKRRSVFAFLTVAIAGLFLISAVDCVYALNSRTSSANYGVAGVANGAGATENRGVYGSASGATTNWAGYFDGANLPGRKR